MKLQGRNVKHQKKKIVSWSISDKNLQEQIKFSKHKNMKKK
jgi:hypothetical protein